MVGMLARALSTSSKTAAKARNFILRKRMFSLRDLAWRQASVRDDERKERESSREYVLAQMGLQQPRNKRRD